MSGATWPAPEVGAKEKRPGAVASDRGVMFNAEPRTRQILP